MRQTADIASFCQGVGGADRLQDGAKISEMAGHAFFDQQAVVFPRQEVHARSPGGAWARRSGKRPSSEVPRCAPGELHSAGVFLVRRPRHCVVPSQPGRVGAGPDLEGTSAGCFVICVAFRAFRV